MTTINQDFTDSFSRRLLKKKKQTTGRVQAFSSE